MKLIFGSSVPPGLSNFPSLGELKVRMDRVEFNEEMICQHSPGSPTAEMIMAHGHVEALWWGDATPSGRTPLPGMQTEDKATTVVFSIRTLKDQLFQYFTNMAMANAGLVLRTFIPGKCRGAKSDFVLGCASIRLEGLTPETPIQGWFTLLSGDEGQMEENNPATSVGKRCVGRVRLAIQMRYFEHAKKPSVPPKKGPPRVTPVARRSHEQPEENPTTVVDKEAPQNEVHDAHRNDSPTEGENGHRYSVSAKADSVQERDKTAEQAAVDKTEGRTSPIVDFKLSAVPPPSMMASHRATVLSATGSDDATADRSANHTPAPLAPLSINTVGGEKSQHNTPAVSNSRDQERDFLKPVVIERHPDDVSLSDFSSTDDDLDSSSSSSTCSVDNKNEEAQRVAAASSAHLHHHQHYHVPSGHHHAPIAAATPPYPSLHSAPVTVSNPDAMHLLIGGLCFTRRVEFLQFVVRASRDVMWSTPPTNGELPSPLLRTPIKGVEVHLPIRHFSSDSRLVIECFECVNPRHRELLGIAMLRLADRSRHQAVPFRSPLHGGSVEMLADCQIVVEEDDDEDEDTDDPRRREEEAAHPPPGRTMGSTNPPIGVVPSPPNSPPPHPSSAKRESTDDVNKQLAHLLLASSAAGSKESHHHHHASKLLPVTQYRSDVETAEESSTPPLYRRVEKASVLLCVTVNRARHLPKIRTGAHTPPHTEIEPQTTVVVDGILSQSHSNATGTALLAQSPTVKWTALEQDRVSCPSATCNPTFNFQQFLLVEDGTSMKDLRAMQLQLYHVDANGDDQEAHHHQQALHLGSVRIDLRSLPYLHTVCGWYHLEHGDGTPNADIRGSPEGLGQLHVECRAASVAEVHTALDELFAASQQQQRQRKNEAQGSQPVGAT